MLFLYELELTGGFSICIDVPLKKLFIENETNRFSN